MGVVEYADAPAIPWGTTEYVLITINTTGLLEGNNTLLVTADADGSVAEINETNNDGEFTVTLAAEALPDLTVESFSIVPNPPTVDGFAQISVVIGNDGTLISDPAGITLTVVETSDLLTTDTIPAISPTTTSITSTARKIS